MAEQASETRRMVLSVPETAELLGVRPGLVWQLVWTGELRSTRVGRFVRIRLTDVNRYLDTQDVGRYLEKRRQRAATRLLSAQ